MAVTELALLHIPHPSPDTTIPPTLLANLKTAASAQATFSKHPVAIYQCIEDPSLIYLIGGWPSVDFHMTVWIPSPKNQELLKLLSDDLEVNWVQHIDLDPGSVFTDGIASTAGNAGGVLTVGRHFLKPGREEKEGFVEFWERSRKDLEEDLGGKDRVAGGWRVDKERREDGVEKEEFVLFNAWESVDQHMAFGKSENFNKYAKIRDYLEGVEIKCGKRIVVAMPGGGSE